MYSPALENSFLLQPRTRHGRTSEPGTSKTRTRVQAETTPQRPRRSKIRESRLGSLSKTGTRARKREAQTSPNFYVPRKIAQLVLVLAREGVVVGLTRLLFKRKSFRGHGVYKPVPVGLASTVLTDM